MMQKIIIIDNCNDDCPYGKPLVFNDVWCKKLDRQITDGDIPADCPLEGIQDYV